MNSENFDLVSHLFSKIANLASSDFRAVVKLKFDCY